MLYRLEKKHVHLDSLCRVRSAFFSNQHNVFQVPAFWSYDSFGIPNFFEAWVVDVLAR